MRQQWNMYVSFDIQQFVILHDYITHRALETVEERNLCLARYSCRCHLENLAPVNTYLIRTMGTVKSNLAISHPGFLSMSTNSMDKYMASMMPNNVTEMDSQSSPYTHKETAATNDDGDTMDTSTVHPLGSSLAVAAAKIRSDDESESSTHDESGEFQTQEEAFKPACPVNAKAIEYDIRY